MKKLRYYVVDVFTDRPFGGNQLAVFPDGRDLSPQLMQQLAREINFSETTFVLPPKDSGSDFWVRIFTPAVEMPMAGHPTVGTAFVLGREQLIDQTGPETMIRFEEGVGVIPVRVQWQLGQPGLIKMSQPLPQFGPEFPDRVGIAAMLSLEPDEIDADYPVQVVSCGVPFLFVPLKNLAAIRRAKLRLDLWEQQLKDFASPHLFVFTTETELENSSVHCRMFAPALGIVEDPATGAASGPLGCYLAKYSPIDRRPKTEDRQDREQIAFVSEQGFEMGRPSLIHIEIEQANGQITGVTVGGQCVFMGEGYFELPES